MLKTSSNKSLIQNVKKCG